MQQFALRGRQLEVLSRSAEQHYRVGIMRIDILYPPLLIDADGDNCVLNTLTRFILPFRLGWVSTLFPSMQSR